MYFSFDQILSSLAGYIVSMPKAHIFFFTNK